MSDDCHVDALRNPLTTQSFVPRGPKGLWDALVAASADARAVEAEACGAASVGDAHLAYMARLGQPHTADVHAGAGDSVAEVIDLGAYRLTRIAV